MKVFVCEPIHEKAMEYLKERAEILTNWEELERADAVIRRNFVIDKAFLDKAPCLKLISVHGSGTDGIDLEEADRRGITVTTAPGENARSVAELALTLMLALSKRIVCADRRLRAGIPTEAADRALQGSELYGKKLGILGVGNIGCITAELAGAFGMEVYGFSRHPQAAGYKEHRIQPCESLTELLEKADVLHISLPLTEATCGMIGEKELALMKPNAFLVNTARGAVVDERALYEALQNGVIAGAASDVFCEEPPTKEHPLLSLPNFIATPHIGANTEEALYRVGMRAICNLKL